MSQALWFIVSKVLHCITSHYFDDFPTLERVEGCKVLTFAFSAVLDLLGWEHAKEGDKAISFASTFDLLGVTFDLNSLPKKTFAICNKVSLIEKLCKMLEEIEKDRSLSAAKASELQGLLNFAAVSFYMGRGLKHFVSTFMPFVEGQRTQTPGELVNLCNYAKLMLQGQKPRAHPLGDARSPVLIFTDGAYENGVATAGAVVIDGPSRMAFVVKVPEVLIKLWIRVAGEQIISQVELWALVSVRWCLRKQLHGRCVIEWIDNEAARVCTIKANSPSISMKVLARLLADLELHWPTFSWIERVCSFSNPSDWPSRGTLEEALHKYNLTDGGILDASIDMADLVLDLHQSPYNTALQKLGT